jgi:hypothetical protein
MNIQKIIQTVTVKQVKKAQKTAQKHFESGIGSSQMNMIAFD